MSNIRYRFLPTLPFTSSLFELNFRTYVKKNNIAGALFLSLDITNPIAVEIQSHEIAIPNVSLSYTLQRK